MTNVEYAGLGALIRHSSFVIRHSIKMRRFSQRNSLVTLSEINITPLLDLAFVLLIIFVITTPLLEQSLPVQLAKGGATMDKFDPSNVKTVEITSSGVFALDRTRMTPVEIERRLVDTFRRNPNMVVAIRADKDGKNEYLYDIINRCQRNGITKFSLRTDPNR
jgi:biopolymer transport protein ExbD